MLTTVRVSRCWAVGVVIAAAPLLIGCGVPDDGRLGVGRADDGSLMVYLRACNQPLDGATLYWPDDPAGADSNEEVFAEWTILADDLSVEWPLLGRSGQGVVAKLPLTSVPGTPKNLGIYAWTRDNTTSASGPFVFTADDLDALKPGEVLVENVTGTDASPPIKAISRADFDNFDCGQFEDP